jgi:DNA repair exonuclease SbcCD ATPase subunit
LAGSREAQKYSEFFDSRAAIERIAADRHSRDAGLSLLYGLTTPSDKSKTAPNKGSLEVSKSKSFVTNPNYRVVGKNEVTELDRNKLNEILSNTQRELQNTRENLHETQNRYEKIVKDLKYYINEIESENLKLTRELAGVKQVNKKDVKIMQDNKIFSDFNKKVKDLEDQCRFYVQENIKLKQSHEKEVSMFKISIKEAESKVEALKREFSSFHSKNKKDHDNIVFKEEYIKKMQEGIKEKSKAIFDLRQANEQYIKFLEEKDVKINGLEKDLKKEKESSKFYADRLNELMIEKINEGKKAEPRGKSLINNKKTPGVRSNQSFEPETSFSIKNQVHGKGDERKSEALNEFEARNQSLLQENSFLRKELKELNEKFRTSEEANKSLKTLMGKHKKEVTPRGRKSENSPFDRSKEIIIEVQNKLAEALREKEMLNKCILDRTSESESIKKKVTEYEDMIKSMHYKLERLLEEKEELLQERKIFQKKSRNEKDLMQELSNLQDSISRGLKLLDLKPKLSKKSLVDDLELIWSTFSNFLQNFKESDENLQKLDEENQFLNDENKEFKSRVDQVDKILQENERLSESLSNIQKELISLKPFEKSLKTIKNVVKNLKIFVGLSYEERGIDHINDDLEDILIEVQQVFDSHREINEKMLIVLKENEKLTEKVKDLEESQEFYENAAEDLSILQEKNKELEDSKKLENDALIDRIKTLTEENDSLQDLLLQENLKVEEIKETSEILIIENEKLKEKLETLEKESFVKASFENPFEENQEDLKKSFSISKEMFEDLINEKSQECSKLQEKCEDLEIKNDRLQLVDNQLKELIEKLNILEAEKNESLGIISEKNEEIAHLKEFKEKFEELVEEHSQLESIRSKYQDLYKENLSFKSKQKETESFSLSYSNLKASHEKLSQEHEDLQSNYRNLSERFECLSEIHDDLTKKQESFLKTEENYQELQDDYAKLLEKSSRTSELVEQLYDENSKLTKNNEELILSSSRSARTDDLSRELNQLQQENHSLQDRIFSLSQKLSRKRLLSSQIEMLTSENQNLTERIDELIELSSEHEREKIEMMEKIEEMQDVISKKESKIEKFRVGSRSLERKLSRTETKTQAVIFKLDNEKQEIIESLRNEYLEQIEGLNEKVNKLSTENFLLEEEISRKEEEITQLMEELSTNRKELKKYIKENSVLDERIEEIREELKRTKEITENDKEIEPGSQELVDVKIDYQEKVDIFIEFKAVVDSRREDELNEIINQLENKISLLEDHINNIKNESRDKNEIIENHQELSIDIQFQPDMEIVEENARLKKEIQKLMDSSLEKIELRIDYQSFENIHQVEIMKQEISSKNSEIQVLENEIRELKLKLEESDGVSRELQRLKLEIDEKNVEIDNLKKEAADWQMKYNKLAFSESSPSSGSED